MTEIVMSTDTFRYVDCRRPINFTLSPLVSTNPAVRPNPITELEGYSGCPFSRHPSLMHKPPTEGTLPRLIVCNICHDPLKELYTNVCRQCLNPHVIFNEHEFPAPHSSKNKKCRLWNLFTCCSGRKDIPPSTQITYYNIKYDSDV